MKRASKRHVADLPMPQGLSTALMREFVRIVRPFLYRRFPTVPHAILHEAAGSVLAELPWGEDMDPAAVFERIRVRVCERLS